MFFFTIHVSGPAPSNTPNPRACQAIARTAYVHMKYWPSLRNMLLLYSQFSSSAHFNQREYSQDENGFEYSQDENENGFNESIPSPHIDENGFHEGISSPHLDGYNSEEFSNEQNSELGTDNTENEFVAE